MKPWTEELAVKHLLAHGSLITLVRWTGSDTERFILEPEEIVFKELQDDKPKL